MSAKICESCGEGNDGTRVFCTNCGVRLVAPPPAEESPAGKKDKKKVEKPVVSTAGSAAPKIERHTARRQAELATVSGRTGVIRLLLHNAFGCVLLSAFLAALIQFAREPDNIPPAPEVDLVAAGETLSILNAAAAAPGPSSWVINQNAINQFLVSTIQKPPTEAGASKFRAEFQRAWILLQKNKFIFSIEKKFAGQSLFFLLQLEPGKSGAAPEHKLDVEVIGAEFGHLPIHPLIIPYIMPIFQPVIDGLKPPLESLRAAESVEITPTDVKLVWAGTKTPKPAAP